MPAKAVCSVCSKEESIETLPQGLALMPKEWLCSVRLDKNEYIVLDVCSTECAQAYDKSAGLPDTVIEQVTEDGETLTETLEHKSDN
jgi:hypothetical protein